MKKIYLALLALTLGVSAQAQRKIRIQVTIDSPLNNQNIITGSVTPPVYTFKNIGTTAADSIGAGEQISFYSPTSVVVSTSPTTFSTTTLTLGAVLKIGQSFKLSSATITGGYTIKYDSIKTLLNTAATSVIAKPFTANTQYLWFVGISGFSKLATNPGVDSVFGNLDTQIIWINKKPTSINEFVTEEAIRTFPNPAVNQLSFEYNLGTESATASIVDIAGRTITSKEIESNGNNKFDMDITAVQSGMYFLRLTVGDKTITSKFNVQK